MNTISQIARFRQSVVTYSFRFGVPAAVRRFNVSRASVYRWRARFNGQTSSLQDRSRRPHHPNQHTTEELTLIRNMRRRSPNAGLVVLWVKLMERGYSRSVVSLWRILKRQRLQPEKKPNPKYIPQPYEQMTYPGQRVQVDVKVVPLACIVPDENGIRERYYQYTAMDEYSRFRFVAAFKEQNTYASAQFLNMLVAAFPFKIECMKLSSFKMKLTTSMASRSYTARSPENGSTAEKNDSPPFLCVVQKRSKSMDYPNKPRSSSILLHTLCSCLSETIST